MNKDKVYLEGYVIGRAADTLGYKGLLVQLENLDIVEIDKNLVHKEIDKSQPIKLKDVIARLKGFDVDTQKVWLDEILNELGSDYGTLKYKAGYEQGKFDGTMEREKVVVQQFVADWYEKHKNNIDFEIWHYLHTFSSQKEDEFKKWMNKSGEKQIQTLVNMHQFGYEVKGEKRYKVVMPNVSSSGGVLTRIKHDDSWIWIDTLGTIIEGRTHTRKELEQAGFGWVFDCPGIEIEEVE